MKKFLSIILAGMLTVNVFAQNTEAGFSGNYAGATVEMADCWEEFFTELIADICSDWIATNAAYVSFEDYPYADTRESAFILHERDGDGTGKFFNGSIETNIMYIPSVNLAGNQTRVDFTFYKFIGLMAENTIYEYDFNPTNLQFTDMRGFFKLGLSFWLLQYSPFSLGCSFSWIHGYGVVPYDSFCTEGFIRSYPFQPLHLEYRIAFSGCRDKDGYYDNDNLLLHSKLIAGILLAESRFEIYGAWDYFYDDTVVARGNGGSLGIKCYF